MPDQVTVKPNVEPEPNEIKPKQQTADTRSSLIVICALGLGVSFFLPWAQFLGASISGLALTKMNDENKLLWLIPISAAIALVSGITKKTQSVARFAGVLPFLALIFWYHKMEADLFHVMAYGACLSLGFGAALMALPRKGSK
jgi:hypothetical protein